MAPFRNPSTDPDETIDPFLSSAENPRIDPFGRHSGKKIHGIIQGSADSIVGVASRDNVDTASTRRTTKSKCAADVGTARSATLNRSGVIEARYTHGRCGFTTERKRGRETERKNEKGVTSDHRDTLHVSEPRRQTDGERITGVGRLDLVDDDDDEDDEELQADKWASGSSWAP